MATQILVPLDGSPLAEQALSCAVTLARGLPAELVLFHAVSIPSDIRETLDKASLKADVLKERLEADADDYLRGMADSLRGAGLSVRHVVQHGPAAETIVDYAAAIDFLQIVMATHGYTGLKHWTHGSVAERVLQLASAPVLLVRAKEEDSEDSRQLMLCRRILVPLDGSDTAEQVLPTATAVAQALRCEIVLFQVPIVYVWGWITGEWLMPIQGVLATAEQDARCYVDRVASRLRQHGVNVSTATDTGSVSESIIQYAEANHIDLIAMCTHGRTGLARWSLGSVADRVLRAGSTPILLVRAM
jgi:nucleotide-binding universal stress UspA family protein